jgi:hypothetical protein
MSQSDFTQEEISNMLVLIEAGARNICAQTELTKAGEILAFAAGLSAKIKATLAPNVDREKNVN